MNRQFCRPIAAGDQIAATFDNRDRMRTQGQEVFTYNKNGELTARENTQSGKTAAYTYDTFGNMTGASTEDGQQITYKLDADANRATREVNGQVQARFIYAPGIRGPVAELAAGNTLRARYVYASRSNVPDYMVKGGNTYRLLTDQLGSVRMVVDASSGNVAQEIEYDPFGSITKDTNEGFQPFGFAGGLYDPATGLTHFGAREYDAGMGRWTAGDPISFEGGDANLYGYVFSDPVNLLDPSGLFWREIVGPIQFVPQLLGVTLGFCVGVGATLTPAHSSGRVCLVGTKSGEFGIVSSTGAGAGFPVKAEASFGILQSTARCLSDLEGQSYGSGGSIGIGPYSAAGDYGYSTNAAGEPVHTGTVSWAPGVRPVFSGNAGVSQDRTISLGGGGCEC